MKKMRLFSYHLIPVVLLFSATTIAFRHKSKSIQVSPTLKLVTNQEFKPPIFLPSLRAQYFKVNSTEKNSNADVYVFHEKPVTYANLFSAKRFWLQNRLQTKATDTKEKDLGCNKVTSRSYSCSRYTEQNGKYIYEKLFWNSNTDLVLLRASAYTFDHAKAVIEK